MICDVSSRFARFIKMNEYDIVTLAVFYFHSCNVLEDFHMMTDNPYASQFANLLERRLSETNDGTLAQLAYLYARWIQMAGKPTGACGHALDEVNLPIREAVLM
jgi:hypothetical protein